MEEHLFVRVVAGCVLYEDGKYLLVQEKKPEFFGKWGFPAGKVHVGESFQQAAKRETFEETGLDVVVGTPINVSHYNPTEWVLHAFEAAIIGGKLCVDATEQLAAEWFTIERVRQMHASGLLRHQWIIDTIEQSETARKSAA